MIVVTREEFKRVRKELLCRILKVTPKGDLIEVPYDNESKCWLIFPDIENYDFITNKKIYHLRYGRVTNA